MKNSSALFFLFNFFFSPFHTLCSVFVRQTLLGISNEKAKNCRRKKAKAGAGGGGLVVAVWSREKRTGRESQGVCSTLTVR